MMKPRSIQIFVRLFSALAFTSFGIGVQTQTAVAQSQAFTAEDNHALLYAKQIQFSNDGSPVIRMRIADDQKSIHLTPKKGFVVYPDGPGGSFVTLPGGESYTITGQVPQPGKYRYGVILSRAKSPDALKTAETRFQASIGKTETVALGSLFALKGKVFDNREHVLMTERTDDKKAAQARLNQLKQAYPDNDFELYDELQSYPKLTVTLSNAHGDISVVNANLMWLSFDQNEVVVHDIPDEKGNARNLTLNGNLIFTPDSDARLSLVQAASVETILRGIVPAEVFSTAPAAALEAQAIAARTTLISQIGSRHQADPYHLCNTQHCQVYNGLSAATPATDRAIQNTRGQILFSGNELVQSYYSSNCGGSSATAYETWNLPDTPYLVAKRDHANELPSPTTEQDVKNLVDGSPNQSDAFCAKAPAGQKSFSSTKHAHWDVTLTTNDLKTALKTQGIQAQWINDIEVISRGPSGRATKIRVTSDQRELILEREFPIRRFFNNLKSALFYFEIARDNAGHVKTVTFHGAGFGHGVGLCQTGAIGMAQRNYTSQQILEHYYPNTRTEKLW